MANSELTKTLYELYHVKDSSVDEQASSHWKEYSQKLKFRVDETGLPVEIAGYGFGDLEIRKIPYQILCFLGMLFSLSMFPSRRDVMRIIRLAWPLCRRMGLSFNQDAFRQVCSLALIERYLSPAQRERKLQVMMIGDGYGFLASLFKERFPSSTIVLVDLGNILAFQSYYSQRAHPDKVHTLVSRDSRSNPRMLDFAYCPAELLAEVSHLTFDLAVNIASMQEMTGESVATYFQFLRQHMAPDGLFYCCNRERKVLVGGETSDYREYPWHPKDVYLVDERCPWHKYYASFTTTGNGPRVLGIRVPFVNYYDGPTWHRLSRLHTGN